MVSEAHLIFSSSPHKLQKDSDICDVAAVAHSLPKEGTEEVRMKKGLLSIVCLLALSLTAIPVGAQTRYRRTNTYSRYEQRVADSGYRSQVYTDRNYRDRYWNRNRSFWDQHRDKLTTAAGVGAGAVLGGLVGGKKGAIIGALAGGGGAALYTYKLRDRNRYRRY